MKINIILYLIIFIEFLIILFLFLRKRKEEKSKTIKIAIQLLAGVNINPSEIANLTRKGNNEINYILRAYYLYNKNQYEKSFNILITLLAKRKLNTDIKKVIVYFIIKNLIKMKRYSEGEKYIKLIDGLFSKLPENIEKLKGELLLYNNNPNGLNILKKYYSDAHIIGIIKNIKDYKIIKNAVNKDILNNDLFDLYIKILYDKNKYEEIENFIVSKSNDFIYNENNIDLIFHVFKKNEEPEKLFSKIRKSPMNIINKNILLILANYYYNNEELELKLILRELKNNNEYEKHKKIIIHTLIITKFFKYIPLFAGG